MDPRVAGFRGGWRLPLAMLGALLAAGATGGLVRAQDPTEPVPAEAPAPPSPAAQDALQQTLPADTAVVAPDAAPPLIGTHAPKPTPKPQAKTAEVAPVIPPEPPKPLRSPTAILQALDKVTAETLRFAAPVGRRIRYKTLVFTVKACETSGIDDPQPSASAYVVIESEPRRPPGAAPLAAKQVYKGWMNAIAPGLHPFEHPIYDAWLIACSASAPPA